MDKKLKDLKDEVLVVTNAAEGNTPHVVEDIEPEGGLKTRPLAGAKPSDQFMRIDRNVSILETFFLNMKRQFERPSDFRFCHLPADLLASAKELVGLFKQPESNSALLDEYRLDTEQYVQSRQQAQQQSGAVFLDKIHCFTPLLNRILVYTIPASQFNTQFVQRAKEISLQALCRLIETV